MYVCLKLMIAHASSPLMGEFQLLEVHNMFKWFWPQGNYSVLWAIYSWGRTFLPHRNSSMNKCLLVASLSALAVENTLRGYSASSRCLLRDHQVSAKVSMLNFKALGGIGTTYPREYLSLCLQPPLTAVFLRNYEAVNLKGEAQESNRQGFLSNLAEVL